jgi:deoxyribodipyrimidine photo-lyase
MEKIDAGLMWFRRDLRLDDNAALHHALKHCRRVVCVFIFDKDILDDLPRQDRRVSFIWDSLVQLGAALRAHGGALIVRHARAADEIPRLAHALQVQAVFANHDYEPAAVARDAGVAKSLKAQGQALHTFKDHVIFEKDEVLTGQGKFFSVFTPYKNAWLKRLHAPDGGYFLKPYSIKKHASVLTVPSKTVALELPSLETMGFDPDWRMALPAGLQGGASLFDDFKDRIEDYEESRNFPAVKGPSYLSVHLRFGTVSIRQLVRFALERSQADTKPGAQVWLSELIWRDFYVQVLHHNPHVVDGAFKPDYDRIAWERGEPAQALFKAWCEGRTGYPIVDAAMMQINSTGYMHNRLRMIVASFLTKDLGIDWRWGERYFAEKLNDFDLSANNGGWQWAASSGCDAQPYFRIFNPTTQSEKFDPDGKFIKRYLPQLASLDKKNIHAPWLMEPMLAKAAGVQIGTDYPQPIVQHDQARKRTLARYAVVKKAVQ